MSPNKPFAPACERNREPILQALQSRLPEQARILEIGSGTGQHAAYFCARQPGWQWQCSDLPENLPGIRQWTDTLPTRQCPPPLALDVLHDEWPAQHYDAVFTANTLHIMPWPAVQALFFRLPGQLGDNGQLFCYGPFNENGCYTAPSNAQFDLWLKERNPAQGIRDLEALVTLGEQAGLHLQEQLRLPANNSLLCWQHIPAPN